MWVHSADGLVLLGDAVAHTGRRLTRNSRRLALAPTPGPSQDSAPCASLPPFWQVCVCDPGFASADCSAECPKAAGVHCGSHGVCMDNSTQDAQCVCDPDWYGLACAVHCVPDNCHPGIQYPQMPHAVCEPTTGACVCQRNATGQWAGPACNICHAGYWGIECDRPCPCSGHGACSQHYGDCECFSNEASGHWAGYVLLGGVLCVLCLVCLV